MSASISFITLSFSSPLTTRHKGEEGEGEFCGGEKGEKGAEDRQIVSSSDNSSEVILALILFDS